MTHTATTSASKRGFKPMLTTAGWIAAFLIAMNWQGIANGVRGPVEYTPAAGPVTLYSTSWCGYCAKTRRFLERNEVPFVELDVETSAEAGAAFAALGGRGVPVVTVGDRVVHGYNLARLRAELEAGSP